MNHQHQEWNDPMNVIVCAQQNQCNVFNKELLFRSHTDNKSTIPTSHVSPVKPSKQVQENPLPSSEHEPLLAHGLLSAQGFTSTTDIKPINITIAMHLA